MGSFKAWVWLVVLSSLVGSMGCSRAPSEASGRAKAASEPTSVNAPSSPTTPGSPTATSTSTSALPREPALVTTIDLSLTVASLEEATRRVREETARADGYVSSMSASGASEGRDRRATFVFKIPAARLGAFRAALNPLGQITSEQERVEDVGEERADRKARLENARAEERRLLQLLAERTGSLADVLAAERELARVRETIERFDAQAAALEGRIAFATVNLSLVLRDAAYDARPVSRIGEAVGDGFRYAGIVFVGSAVALAQVGPTLVGMGLFAFGVFWGIRGLARRVRRASVTASSSR